ncbi:formate dehydrogenase subunit gamma [Motiliproteus sp.]|uniref:formate dehydrogenase subunit gamma n=1 Tax=Motiliproteus sp. TaxID=1898955 RepID=UPI003BAB7714
MNLKHQPMQAMPGWLNHSLMAVLLYVLVIWLLGITSAVQAAQAANTANSASAMAGAVTGTTVGNRGADYWRQVTRGESGYSTHRHDEAGVLINRSGEDWRLLRNDTIKTYGAWALGVTLIGLVLVYLLFGANKLDSPRSGRTVERWKRVDRYLHWTVAGLFIVLTITGLSILYGRHFLPELMGKGAFGSYMSLGKLLHNYLGVLFAITLVIMLLKWLANNLPTVTDIQWFLQGGGMIKGKHPHAGYMNGGEKLWFWVLFLGGVVLMLSGLVLDFPAYFDNRDDFQLANLFHAVSALVLICGATAHAYIGSVGTEGALEGMTTGQVDETWAKQHHDLWYEQIKADASDGKAND